ncbi:MAG: glycosyltransferase family 2 protein [Planctomycetota bacterium]|jgi:glycosyltransferase involved in cell wall biosynthesis
MISTSYLIVSPCRNEAAYARRTLDSVCEQSIPPKKWVIVDDGSQDGTPELLKEYAEKYPFIQVISREDRGVRSVGPGVIEAFYAGYETIDPRDYEFVCKLDLDLEMPGKYFEELISRMNADPRIGTCSGKAYFESKTGEIVSESIGDDVSVGAAKFYRTACFRQIGGFVREVMWDGIDCHRSRMLGWKACSWDDPEIRFLHLRPMGSSHKGIWHGRMRHGYGQYFMGSSLVFMLASAVNRAFNRPILMGSLAMISGFVSAMLRRAPRYPHPEFRAFLRKYQTACLLHGKSRAMKLTEDAQAERWRPSSFEPMIEVTSN